jgi:hypothetical protein
MRNPARVLAVLLALSFGATSVAWAGPGNGNGNGNGNSGGGTTTATATGTSTVSNWGFNGQLFCGGNSFNTCASVSATVTHWTGGITHVQISVTNWSGFNGSYPGTIFTQVGLANMPSGASYVTNSLTVTENGQAVSGWQTGTNGLSGVGIQKNTVGVDPTNGINNGIPSPLTYVFNFDVTGWANPVDITTAQFAIHGQGGPNGCSTKLVITNGVANTVNPNDVGACIEGPPTTVTPEPITMSLLATGLAGIGGARMARRRRRTEA